MHPTGPARKKLSGHNKRRDYLDPAVAHVFRAPEVQAATGLLALPALSIHVMRCASS